MVIDTTLRELKGGIDMPNNLKVDLSNLNDIAIYELLLQGTILSFPSGFWANRSAQEAELVL